MRRRFSVSILSVGLLACSAAMSCVVGGEDTRSEGSEGPGKDSLIIGGAVTNGDPAVLFLSSSNASCTGTLVAPRVVLTAGHCFSSGARVSAGGYIGTVRRHPNFTITQWGAPVNDMGVVVLDQPILTIDPLPIGSANPGIGARKVGYGYHDSAGTLNYDGNKRTVNVGFRYDSGSPYAFTDNAYLYMGKGGCYGDSGGPTLQLIANAWTIVGITSFVNNNCFGNTWDWVAQRGAQWVQSVIAETHACSNGKTDFNETDTDCGGGTCQTCPRFAFCLAHSDCQTNRCDYDENSLLCQ